MISRGSFKTEMLLENVTNQISPPQKFILLSTNNE